jgi:enoyl-CoA hydratase/carnithine racemase
MYKTFKNLVEYANENEEVKFIIVSGAGGNYSSGNDLTNFANPKIAELGPIEQVSHASAAGLEEFTASIINSTKPIFAICEGTVIGFAFTQLALYDRIFAVEGAKFRAPLVQLAQGPEMCASYTFPKFFGARLGEDLIVKGTKVDAAFLAKHNFLEALPSKGC